MPSRTTVAQIAMALGLLGMLGGALGLASCMTSQPEPDASSSPSAEPTPSAAPVTAAVIPTDCTDVVAGEELYRSTFGDTPLNDPGFGEGTGALEPAPPAADATAEETIRAATRLFCVWGDPAADITQLTVALSRVDPGLGRDRLGELALGGEGFECGDALGGTRCQLVRQNEQYPVEEAITEFTRDDVYIRVYQANFPTNGLLAGIVERVYGDDGEG